MSTRILVWNIERFSLNTILSAPTLQISALNGQVNAITTYQKGEQRLAYILANVTLKNPDIFVVVEVSSGKGTHGSLVTVKGADGSQLLLERLRLKDPNWCLVPPLKLIDELQIDYSAGYAKIHGEKSYTEAISVYFRSDKVDFIGPYIWPKAKDPNNIDPATIAVPDDGTIEAGPYPAGWQQCLPANNYYAGQYQFLYAPKKPYLFPAAGSRTPFLVKFEEKETGRLLSLYCVHFPPKSKSAVNALSTLTDYIQDQPLAVNEIVLVLGDLNINGTTNIFNEMGGIGTNKKFLVPVFDSKSSLKTSMYIKKSTATPKMYLNPNLLLDNVLYRYGEDLMQIDIVSEIIDRVTNNSLMATPLQQILTNPSVTSQKEIFMNFMNFGRLGSSPGGTSDHLALFVQV